MTDETTPFGDYAPRGWIKWIVDRTRALPDNWPARRLAFLMRRLAVRALRGRPLDMPTLGANMRLYPYNNICEKRILFTPQFFDRQELALLEKHITEGFAFIDIGANIGAYSLFVAARAGRAARILAVEPQPDIFDRLTYNIQQNPFGTVKAVACAVADKAGEMTLFLAPRNSGEAGVRLVVSSHANTIRVPATTLLDLVRSEAFTHIDAIKIDVEGAEDLVIEPFLRDAPRELHPKLLMIENGRSQWQMDLPTFLEETGYRQIAATRLNLIYARD